MVMKRMTCSYELLPLWAFWQTFPSEVTNAPSERSPTEFRNTIPWCRIHCASVHGAIRAAVCCATPGSQKSGFGVLSSHILVMLAFFPVRSRDAGWKLESRVQMLQPIAKKNKKIPHYETELCKRSHCQLSSGPQLQAGTIAGLDKFCKF